MGAGIIVAFGPRGLAPTLFPSSSSMNVGAPAHPGSRPYGATAVAMLARIVAPPACRAAHLWSE
jgi:hypothetical protein